jgi:two-component system LytT family response regulator
MVVVLKIKMPDGSRIILHTTESIYFIKINDILYCKSNNSYTTFYTRDNESVMVSKNIKDCENFLAGYGFIRPHQSYLVNLEHLQRIDKTNGFQLILTGNISIPSSTRRKKELFQILQKRLRFQDGLQQIQI